jgi:thioredoxin-like negative regulator of GroEL
MLTNAQLAKDCRTFADDAGRNHASIADLAMFAELQNMKGSEDAAELIRSRSTGENRLRAAWLILADALEATNTPEEANAALDSVDDADTRQATKELLTMLNRERDCPNCGQQISLLAGADRVMKWRHEATFSESCATDNAK